MSKAASALLHLAVLGCLVASAQAAYCSGAVTLTDATGTFESNDSGDYAPDMHCSWLISPPGVETVTVSFTQIMIETENDLIYIYDGATTEAPLILEYHGGFDQTGAAKQIYASSGPSMLIVFTSNSNQEFSGFKASYYSGNAWSCHGTQTLTASTGSFTSGTRADYHDVYGNMKTCSWLIAPTQTTTTPILLTFSSFSTEQEWDVVSVYDGDSNQAPLLRAFSGDYAVAPIAVAYSGKMFVEFVSDLFVSLPGFDATYFEGSQMAASTCLTYNNKDWHVNGEGWDIGRVDDVPDKDFCCALCSATPNCNAFTWNRWTKICWIKNVDEQTHMAPHPYGVAGVPCPDNSCYVGRSYLAQTDFLGADVHSVAGVSDFAACNKLCMDYQGDVYCNAVTFNSITSQCYLKNVDHTRWVLDPNPAGVAGVPCPNGICPKSCRTEKKTKYVGTPIDTVNLDNSSAETKNVIGSCCQACHANPSCAAYSYRQDANECQLFDNTATTTEDKAYHSGVPCRAGSDCSSAIAPAVVV